MTLGEVVKQYLETHKITYEAFAAQCGLTKGYVSMLVNGKNPKTGKPPVPKVETYLRIAEAMGITAKELLEQTEKDTPTHFYIVYGPGKGQTREVSAKEFFNHHTPSNVRPISSLHAQRVPMIGEVAAGEPVYAPEEAEVYVDSPVKCDAAITIRGDSMVPNYLDGDVVYIRCRPDVDDGQVAVVFLDDEAAIKHVYHEPNGLLLLSDNPQYPPIRATVEDYPGLRIFGVPVGFTRMFTADVAGKVRKGVSK